MTTIAWWEFVIYMLTGAGIFAAGLFEGIWIGRRRR